MSQCPEVTSVTIEKVTPGGEPVAEERGVPCTREEGHAGMHSDGEWFEWTRCPEDHLCCDDPSTEHSHFLDTEDCPRCSVGVTS